ncbi:MAG: hypothetical protein NUW02_00940 [Candidatus Campbellbacteria bacterium]|nr:hypothetical protein [Candidatus Campbellbacteria bacterium]
MSNGRFPNYPGSKKEGMLLKFPSSSSIGKGIVVEMGSETEKPATSRAEVARKFYRMELYLGALQGRIRPENIASRKSGLKELSDSQLLNVVENSSETTWGVHPSFYWALSEIIRERGIPLLP